MERRFTNQLDRAIGDVNEELEVETTVRQQLEERIPSPQTNSSKKTTTPQRMLAVKKRLTKQ